jgi:biopolymer transport protein ExbB
MSMVRWPTVVVLGFMTWVLSGWAPAHAAKPGTVPVDLSPLGMFLAADIVVKAVMVALAVASIAVWVIGIAKALQLRAARRRLSDDLERLRPCLSLDQARAALAGREGLAPRLLEAIDREVQALGPRSDSELLKTVIASRTADERRRVQQEARSGLGFLATVGATAPFIGLFGTVWGIMNSFIGISRSQTTNLAVVAPGIAEALLATAIGLVAAIPAVILYNSLGRSIAACRLEFDEVGSILERCALRDRARGQAPELRSYPHAAE